MRTGVYFSLGAGCTGLVALGTGQGALGSLAWGLLAGAGIAALARFLRRSLRRDLDSSFSPEEFLLEEAQVIVPIGPGMMGKVEVRKYRAEDPAQAFARGARVRLIDYREGSYLVEPADEEHLVH
jgi:membrane protein implicated in regulation of membrane protease activity